MKNRLQYLLPLCLNSATNFNLNSQSLHLHWNIKLVLKIINHMLTLMISFIPASISIWNWWFENGWFSDLTIWCFQHFILFYLGKSCRFLLDLMAFTTTHSLFKRPLHEKTPLFFAYLGDPPSDRASYKLTGCKQVPPKGHPSNVLKKFHKKTEKYFGI